MVKQTEVNVKIMTQLKAEGGVTTRSLHVLVAREGPHLCVMKDRLQVS